MSPAAGDSFWRSWEGPLTSYSSAAGLTVSMYDATGSRRLGPLLGSRLAVELATANVWDPDRPAHALEAALARQAIETTRVQAERLGDLIVTARPMVHGPKIVGAITAGWVADRFMTSLDVMTLARRMGSDPSRLWRIARAETPISPARFEVLMQLLDTLVGAHAAHQLSLERANELSATRDRFLTRAAHELRTPLAAIAMRTELLLADTTLAPALRTALEKIAANAAVEARLIEDLIDAGRTLTGNLRITIGPVSLFELVADCVDSAQPAARVRDITLTFASSVDTPVRVLGDGVRLRQAFSNLITNALKFTTRGGTVASTLGVDAERVEIVVSDSGQGIAADALARVFEPFVKSEHNNESGLGLGLAITRQIVEQHGGEIVAASAGVGRGSTFTVRLPLVR